MPYLKNGHKIDAIYTLNNHIATACLNVFTEMGFDAEAKGIQFASFDDIGLFDFVKPFITSVAQPLEQIGTEAANLTLSLIDDKGATVTQAKNIVLPTSIVNRG